MKLTAVSTDQKLRRKKNVDIDKSNEKILS